MKGKGFICFVAGAAIGGATAWYLTKRKYEELNEKDAESFRKKLQELKEKKEESASIKEESPAEIKKRNDEIVESVLEGVKKIQAEHKYTNYSDADPKPSENKDGEGIKGSESDFVKKIDIKKITKDEFYAEDDGYTKNGINVYVGGFDTVFTDDADQKMSDGYLSETIGLDIRDEIIDSDKTDDIYVRNLKTKTDYEIVFELQSWEDAHNR